MRPPGGDSVPEAGRLLGRIAKVGADTAGSAKSVAPPTIPDPADPRVRAARDKHSQDQQGGSRGRGSPGKSGGLGALNRASKAVSNPAGALGNKAVSKISEKSETLGSAIRGATTGAAKGGIPGAALGAVKGLTKTRNGRRLLALGGLTAFAGPIAAFAVVLMVVTSIFGGQAQTVENATQAGQSAGISSADMAVYWQAQQDTGTPWEVLASLHQELAAGVGNTGGANGTQPKSGSPALNLDGWNTYLAKLASAGFADPPTARQLANPAKLPAGLFPLTGVMGPGAATVAQTKDGTVVVSKQAFAAVEYAIAQLGKPYVYGATGPDSFDCSGLVIAAYRSAGVTSIPRVSWDQYAYTAGARVPAGQERPGDLVFFTGDDGSVAKPGHVGIVIDPVDHLMINAPETGIPVEISNYSTWGGLVGFGRPMTPASQANATGAAGTPTTESGDYVGPFDISATQLASDDVSPATVTSLSGAAEYIGSKFYAALQADPSIDTSTMPIDSGRMDSADAPSSIDPDSASGQIVAMAYPKAIAALPVEGMSPPMAQRVFGRALAWALGNQYTDSALTNTVACTTTSSTGAGLSVPTATGGSLTLDAGQVQNAAIIIGVASKLGINQNGAIAALMAALQESKLKMLANSNVPASLDYPHQGVGSDHKSVNDFQQQPGWGPDLKTLMDPTYAAYAFFGAPPNFPQNPNGVLQIPGWQSMDPAVLAQTVQVSAFPDAYAQWRPAAIEILGKVSGVDCSDLIGQSPLGPDASARQEATALLNLWGTRLVGTADVKADLTATAQGEPIDNADTCGRSIPGLDPDLLRLYLIMSTRYKVTVWNFVTGHGCDAFYHPSGNASDIGDVTDLQTGQSTNFVPGSTGNHPTVVAAFDSFVAASGPNHLGMGQAQCADTAGASAQYQQIAFDDTCTHQHVNVRQGSPPFQYPYAPETWPASASTPSAGT